MSADQTWTVAVDPPDDLLKTPTGPRFVRGDDDSVPARAHPAIGRPSARRSEEERVRRHRERAIAAWLRDLSR